MLEIGSIVDGKYKILNKIGQGGMSVVYLAMNERANKQWAIKEIRKDGVSNYEVVKQGLIVETDLLKKLNHPHLPSIIDVIDGDGTFLIVMDYIEGNALNKILKQKGAQSQTDVIEWSKQLCDVLGYLHSRKPPIVYRDMKPSNVMLKPDNTVTLIDFGTAREYKSQSIADTTCLGTQGYAAPEQFGGQGQTDGRTDIYCLGATMYHLVTGHNPAEPPYEMYPIRQWNPSLSSGLEAIILKCTQKNPNDRYQSCAELMYDLEHYTELELETKREYKKKWRAFIATSVMCIVSLIGTIGFKVAANNVTNSTYDYYIEKASESANGSDWSSAEENLKNAIELAPDRADAYLALLEDVYLSNDDNHFSNEEASKFRSMFDKNEDALKKNDLDNYYEIAFMLGEAYGLSFENSNELQEAKKWYDIAVKSEKLDSSKVSKAKVLSKIYYWRYAESLVNDRGELIDSPSDMKTNLEEFYEILSKHTSNYSTMIQGYDIYFTITNKFKSQLNSVNMTYSYIADRYEEIYNVIEDIDDSLISMDTSDVKKNLINNLLRQIDELRKESNKNND